MKIVKKSFFVCFAVFLNALSAIAQIKIDIAHFKKLMNDGSYVTAYNEAMAIRKQPYGKCFQVDYIIGKCLCETNNLQVAKKCFSQLSNYPLSEKMKDLVNEEEKNCGKPRGDDSKDELLSLLNIIANTKNDQPVSISRGKLGTVINCNQNSSGSSAGDFELKINMTQEEFSERLFTLNEKKKAKLYYDQLLGAAYKVDTAERFILITRKAMGSSEATAVSIAKKLEKAYTFFTASYELRAPDKLIAVYLMGDKPALQGVALKVHRFNLPKENIGYSCLGDLSVLGTSDTGHVGTLYHELFHLVVRAHIGDIPAWLDEGVASIYETSTWKGNTLKGDVYNWRTEVIKNYMEAGTNRSLQYIIHQNWDGFKTGPKNDVCDIAYNYAYSKHFALFLQEKKLLKTTLQAYSHRKNIFADTSNANETAIEILEKCLGLKMDEIQTQFNEWFNLVYFKNGQSSRYTYPDLLSQLNQTQYDLERIAQYNLRMQDSAMKYIYKCRKYIELKKNNPSIANNVLNTVTQNNVAVNNYDLDFEIEQFLKESHKFLKEMMRSF